MGSTLFEYCMNRGSRIGVRAGQAYGIRRRATMRDPRRRTVHPPAFAPLPVPFRVAMGEGV